MERVRASLIGCREIRYPHTTVLIDDADRDEVVELAGEMGAASLRREDRDGDRGGALNHALTSAPRDPALIAEGGPVQLPDALHRTIGYFDDPRVATETVIDLDQANRDPLV